MTGGTRVRLMTGSFLRFLLLLFLTSSSTSSSSSSSLRLLHLIISHPTLNAPFPLPLPPLALTPSSQSHLRAALPLPLHLLRIHHHNALAAHLAALRQLEQLRDGLQAVDGVRADVYVVLGDDLQHLARLGHRAHEGAVDADVAEDELAEGDAYLVGLEEDC